MKLATKLSGVAVAFSVLGIVGLGVGQVAAFTDGQIEGGDIYRVEDLTTNSGFNKTISANACDSLEYRIRLYNPGSATLNNVNVETTFSTETLSSFVSDVQATASNADPSTTFASSTVNLSSAQKLSYVAGSTQLLDQNTNVVRTLPDGITTSGTGVALGNLGPSVIEFVQFKVNVSCPQTPPPHTTPPSTPVTPTTTTTTTPTQLVNTGPGSTIAIFGGASILGTLLYRYRLTRRLSR